MTIATNEKIEDIQKIPHISNDMTTVNILLKYPPLLYLCSHLTTPNNSMWTAGIGNNPEFVNNALWVHFSDSSVEYFIIFDEKTLYEKRITFTIHNIKIKNVEYDNMTSEFSWYVHHVISHTLSDFTENTYVVKIEKKEDGYRVAFYSLGDTLPKLSIYCDHYSIPTLEYDNTQLITLYDINNRVISHIWNDKVIK